jgi:hypothetical protein
MSNHNGDCPRPTGRPRALLARHLLPSGADGNNVAFSPLSVHSALSLVATGAKGDTLHQLLDFLGAPDLAACVGSNVVAYWLASGWPKVLLGSGVWEDASCGVIQKYFLKDSPYRSIGRALRERVIMFLSCSRLHPSAPSYHIDPAAAQLPLTSPPAPSCLRPLQPCQPHRLSLLSSHCPQAPLRLSMRILQPPLEP